MHHQCTAFTHGFSGACELFFAQVEVPERLESVLQSLVS